MSVAGDEESPIDERREHVGDPLVLVGIELCARRSAPGERVAVTARDEPEQDPTSDSSLGGVERLEAASACLPTAPRTPAVRS